MPWAEIGATEQAANNAGGRGERQFPGDLWINTDLAWLCFYARPPRYDDSVRYYTAALAVSPNSPYITRHLAYALFRKGSFAEAAAAYSRALELKADAVEIRIGRGEAYLRLGERERAMADFARAAEPEPGTAAGWFYRARLRITSWGDGTRRWPITAGPSNWTPRSHTRGTDGARCTQS